jgi:hypothetical protein
VLRKGKTISTVDKCFQCVFRLYRGRIRGQIILAWRLVFPMSRDQNVKTLVHNHILEHKPAVLGSNSKPDVATSMIKLNQSNLDLT